MTELKLDVPAEQCDKTVKELICFLCGRSFFRLDFTFERASAVCGAHSQSHQDWPEGW